MRNNHLVIPSRNRIEKLRKTLSSVDTSIIKPFIVADDCQKTLSEFGGMKTDHHVGAVMCRNRASEKLNGNIIFGTDDICFIPGAIKKVITMFSEIFPDSDGVIGLRQKHPGHHPTGVAMVGESFRKRYPRNWVYCPYYFHFACQEIEWLASKAGKFHYTDFICLEHLPPNKTDIEIDQTHKDARVFKARDKIVRSVRKDLGFIWGNNG